jgi:hypothetical protein
MKTFVTSFFSSVYASMAAAKYLAQHTQMAVSHGHFVYGIAGDVSADELRDGMNAALIASGYDSANLVVVDEPEAKPRRKAKQGADDGEG